MIDAIAFKELYKTVYKDLYRFALCMMHHPQDAEDAVSEAVLSAYELKEDHASATYCDGLRTDVERAFLILDEDDQLIIGLSVYSGYNSKEIGKMLRLNPNTVRSRRKRALEKMSWLLKE